MVGVTLALVVLNQGTKPPPPPPRGPATTVAAVSPAAPPARREVAPRVAVPTTRSVAPSRPSTVRLGMKDFTAACQQQYGDQTAAARVTPNAGEPPSYWVKCFIQGSNVGGINLDQYCSSIRPGTHSDNPKRYDPSVADRPWRAWECVPI